MKIDEPLNASKLSKRSISLSISLLALLVILMSVFARASIEVGGERVWIFLYLFFVPAPIGVIAAWGMVQFSRLQRSGIGLIVTVFVAVLLVQTALFADKVHENPKTFRFILPVAIKLEAYYLLIFSSDNETLIRHKEKTERWRSEPIAPE